MTTTPDQRISALVGLPVIVTYDPTAGRWEAEIDLSEFLEAVEETDPAWGGPSQQELDKIGEAWALIVHPTRGIGMRPTATAPIIFTNPA